MQIAKPHCRPTEPTPVGRAGKCVFRVRAPGESHVQCWLGPGAAGVGILTQPSYRSSIPTLPRGLQGVLQGAGDATPRTKFPPACWHFQVGIPEEPTPCLSPPERVLSYLFIHCPTLLPCLETAFLSTFSQLPGSVSPHLPSTGSVTLSETSQEINFTIHCYKQEVKFLQHLLASQQRDKEMTLNHTMSFKDLLGFLLCSGRSFHSTPKITSHAQPSLCAHSLCCKSTGLSIRVQISAEPSDLEPVSFSAK